MAFVKFTRTRARIGIPKVSIWSRGQVGFNQAAVDEYKLSDFKYVVLYYDQDDRRIGLEFTNDEKADGACKLGFRKGSGVSFSAVAFLKTFKIDYTKTRQYDLTFDETNTFYVIDLNSPRNQSSM